MGSRMTVSPLYRRVLKATEVPYRLFWTRVIRVRFLTSAITCVSARHANVLNV